jgi:two-component system CheB/CheR fusion protein
MNRKFNANQVEDETSRKQKPLDFLIVGLGASAGGIKALQVFFDNMPADSGIAFVVVMHLSPDFESTLAQVLQQRTSMPVLQVNEPVQAASDHVYVIPPNKHLLVSDGMLRLVEPQQPAGRRIAIDLSHTRGRVCRARRMYRAVGHGF